MNPHRRPILPRGGVGILSSRLTQAEQSLLERNGQTLVYELIRVRDSAEPGASTTIVSEVGEMTPDLYQRCARPATDPSPDSACAVTFWTRHRDDGTVEDGFRAMLHPVSDKLAKSAPPGLPYVEPGTASRIADPLAAGDEEPLALMVKLRGVPEWDVPLRPAPELMSIEDYAASLAVREAALVERRALVETEANRLGPLLAQHGGQIAQVFPHIGWALVLASPEAAQVLTEEPLLSGGWSLIVGNDTTPTTDTLTVIDLTVPQGATHFTDHLGKVSYNHQDVGTSFSAPRLGSYALIAKDYYTDNGWSFFNNPGFVHLYMLGMGDRRAVSRCATRAGTSRSRTPSRKTRSPAAAVRCSSCRSRHRSRTTSTC